MAKKIKKDPNCFKIFNPSRGMFLNNNCKHCGERIWASTEIDTQYHGRKHYSTGSHDDGSAIVMSVVTEDGLICWECYKSQKEA